MSEVMISTEALAGHVDQGGVVILDGRPMMGFLMAHIPGALHVDWKSFSDPQAPSKGILHPDLAVLERKIGALGIGNQTPVVCYSDPISGYGEDGRFYWMLTYLGHPNVKILNGGWTKWQQERRPVERGPAKSHPPMSFGAAPRPELLMARDELKQRIATKDAELAIIDTRSPGEYRGQGGMGRAGHLPGAVNIPWNSFYNADGSVKLPEVLAAALKQRGVDGKKEYVVYCAGGVRCSWLFSLMTQAGMKNVRNYVGSWSDWSSDPSAPIEK
jgi:thiosulfate/3-mercaptopyruvate sulfurtransferase